GATESGQRLAVAVGSLLGIASHEHDRVEWYSSSDNRRDERPRRGDGDGARVMVTGRDRSRAEAAARTLGSAAIGCAVDVRDERSIAACVGRACDSWG